MDWTLVVDEPLPGATNMARDHALALSVRGGCGVLRLYRWRAPTLSFGRNEPARELYDRGRARALGVGFVRRPTGGRAVLHDGELTYAVVLPLRSLGGVRETYRSVGRGLVRALRELGVEAELSGDDAGGPAPRPHEGPCFARPVAGEVVARGRKLVGSAQARIGGALLQHGSLLLGRGQERVSSLRKDGKGEPARFISLEELLPSLPAWSRLVRAVRDGLMAELGGSWAEGTLDALRRRSQEEELEARYRLEGWTWRR